MGFIWTTGVLTIVNPGQFTNLTGINDAGLAVGNDESLTFTYDTVTGQLSPVGSPAGVSLNGQAINLY